MSLDPSSQLFKEFQVIRFRPQDIILRHRQTKKHYQYYQITHQARLLSHIQHPNLARPIISSKSLLYLKPTKTLAVELAARCRAHNKIYFTEPQLLNTFLPILECLRSIHSKGVVHGCISKSSIIFDANEDIKLCDWLMPSNINSSSKKSMDDDMKALGVIILECCALQQGGVIDEYLESIIMRYNRTFFLGVLVMVKNIEKYYDKLQQIFREGCEIAMDERMDKLYQEIKIKHQVKAKFNQNINENTQKLSQNVGQSSPVKKFLITTPKKLIKLEECENKKTTNEDIKKKHIEKITKIIERSNAFVNELMSRRTSQSKKTNSKLNVSCQGNQNTNIKKESLNKQSPTKRLRLVQRKK